MLYLKLTNVEFERFVALGGDRHTFSLSSPDPKTNSGTQGILKGRKAV